MFDNPATRPQLQALYNAEQSLLSFEGQQMQVNSLSATQFFTRISALGSENLEYQFSSSIISDAGERQDHGEVELPYLSGTEIS